MKKTYSEHFILQSPSSIKITSREKEPPGDHNSPSKKTFTRKQASYVYLPFQRKKGGEYREVKNDKTDENTMEKFVQKSLKLKFVSTKSDLHTDLSKASFSNFCGQEVNNSFFSRSTLGEESYISSPQISNYQKQRSSKQMFRRKSVLTIRTPTLTKKRESDNSWSDIRHSISQKEQHFDQQTKPQTSQISQIKSFIQAQNCNKTRFKIEKNNSRSSKGSRRKSNSSNSLIKRQHSETCLNCQKNQKQNNQLKVKLQKLDLALKNKDKQILLLNKNILEIQKKNRQIQKKFKQITRQDYPAKMKILEEQIIEKQEQIERLRDKHDKLSQQLKYKTIQNSTLRKYQSQNQGLQRKCQLLMNERNQLRQKMLTIKPSPKLQKPNPLHSSRDHPMILAEKCLPLTSRNDRDRQQDSMSMKYGFKKKKNIENYQDSEGSQIMTLSQESNF